jgi:hypothetical protein
MALLAVQLWFTPEPLSALFNRFNPSRQLRAGLLLHGILKSTGSYLVWWYITSTCFVLPTGLAAAGLGGYGVMLFFMAWYVLLPASALPLRQLPYGNSGQRTWSIAHLGVALRRSGRNSRLAWILLGLSA